MDEQLILFSRIYRLVEGIRAEIKSLQQENQKLLQEQNWETATIIVNNLISMEQTITTQSDRIYTDAGLFLAHGPYVGQRAGVTPIEGLVEGEHNE